MSAGATFTVTNREKKLIIYAHGVRLHVSQAEMLEIRDEIDTLQRLGIV